MYVNKFQSSTIMFKEEDAHFQSKYFVNLVNSNEITIFRRVPCRQVVVLNLF